MSWNLWMHVALLASNWVSAFSPLVMIPPCTLASVIITPEHMWRKKNPPKQMWTLLYAVCMFFILFDFPGNSSLIHSKRLLQCCQGNPGYVCYWLGCIQAAYIDTDTHTHTLKHNNALHKHCVCSGGVANWLNSQGGTIRSGGITCSIRCWQQELTVNIHVLDYIF